MVCSFAGGEIPGTPDGMFETSDGTLHCVQVVRVPVLPTMPARIVPALLSDIFNFLLGEGEGGARGARRGGVRFFNEDPRRGSRGARGAEGPGGCLRRIGDFLGWGGQFLFSGRNVHQVSARTNTAHIP